MTIPGPAVAAIAVAALVATASAHAQSGPVPAGCTADPRQPSCAAISTGPGTDRPAPLGGDAVGTFTIFGKVKGFTFSQADIARTTTSLGSTWRLKGGLSVEAPGGVFFSASTIARRGSTLPIAMAQPLGSDVQLAEGNAALQPGTAPIQWDTELRIRKMLLTSDALDVGVVGEAFNLFNLNGATDPRASATAPMLTSPTVRAGVFLGF